MSKIGKQPVKLVQGVTAEVAGHEIKVTGPKGTLSLRFPRNIEVTVKDGQIDIASKKENKQAMSDFGTTRSLISNMAIGVEKGWSRQLEMVGTGYRAEVAGNKLVMAIGYSHPVTITAPEGITFKVEKTMITIEGANKETVGQVAADIRAVRPPEPYKGKGIKYSDEVIRRKAGKAAKTAGAAA
jgi:large subunit ribosomal protein L6